MSRLTKELEEYGRTVVLRDRHFEQQCRTEEDPLGVHRSGAFDRPGHPELFDGAFDREDELREAFCI